jgi:xanthine dehydrogenase molybdenum-binding subunit
MDTEKRRRIERPLRENPYFGFITWGFSEDPKLGLIGVRVAPKEAEKVLGRAIYTRDVELPGMLYAKWLTSPYAHAIAKRIDVSRAKSAPGVVDVVTYEDEDLHRSEGGGVGIGMDVKSPDWAFVMPREAVYEGQPVAAAVCATSQEACDLALRLLEVEWEELPFVLDRDEALREDAPIAQLFRGERDNVVRELPMSGGTTKVTIGDLEEGFREADRIVEFEIRCGVNVPAGVEAYASLAWFRDGWLDLWVRVHIPAWTIAHVANILHIPLNRIRVHVPYSGASFGGITWIGSSSIPSVLAALLSKRTRKPVKVLADWTNFSGITCEEEGRYTFKVGFKMDGTVTAVRIDSNGSHGYAGLTIPGSKKLPKATRIRHFQLESVYPYVNRAPCVCYKHGTQETIPFIEIFNRVAAELNMDPTIGALNNDGCYGHPMHPDMDRVKVEQGFPVRDSLRECIEAGKKAIGWDEKWHAPAERILPNGRYHGLGFSWTKEWRAAPEVHGAFLASCFFKPDGTVLLRAQRNFIGVSEPTTYCQIFAQESGISLKDIEMDNQFSDAMLMIPGGSGGLCWNSYILRELGLKAKRKILEVASKALPKAEGLDIKDSVVFDRADPQRHISLRELVIRYGRDFQGGIWADGNALVKAIETPPSPMKVHFFGRQASFIEIEVDPETGKIYIQKLVIVNDVGRVINPQGVAGQQCGGGFMGIGRAMTEEIFYDPLTGVKLNDDLLQYPVLTMADIYRTDCIAVETLLGYGAYGNMGVGEDVNCVVRDVLRYAVYNAIGKWINEDPITPERVLKALGKI